MQKKFLLYRAHIWAIFTYPPSRMRSLGIRGSPDVILYQPCNHGLPLPPDPPYLNFTLPPSLPLWILLLEVILPQLGRQSPVCYPAECTTCKRGGWLLGWRLLIIKHVTNFLLCPRFVIETNHQWTFNSLCFT